MDAQGNHSAVGVHGGLELNGTDLTNVQALKGSMDARGSHSAVGVHGGSDLNGTDLTNVQALKG